MLSPTVHIYVHVWFQKILIPLYDGGNPKGWGAKDQENSGREGVGRLIYM